MRENLFAAHYSDAIMSAMASQITGVTIVYPTVCSGTDQRKHESSASLAFVGGIHRWPVNFLHKGPVTRKMFPFDDDTMWWITFPAHANIDLHPQNDLRTISRYFQSERLRYCRYFVSFHHIILIRLYVDISLTVIAVFAYILPRSDPEYRNITTVVDFKGFWDQQA